jgi:hypothetical protein
MDDIWEILTKGSELVLNDWSKIIDLQNKQRYGNILLTETPYVGNVAGQTVNYNMIIVAVLVIAGVVIVMKL